MDQVQTIQQNKGALFEMARQIEAGVATGIAFEQGIQKQTKALQDAQLAVATTQGEIMKLDQQLAAGTIQSVSYAQGMLEVEAAQQKMQVETAKTQGAIMEMSNELGTSQTKMIQFASGVTEGEASILKWGIGIDNAKGKAAGIQSELITLGNRFGLDIPRGINLASDAIQNFIGIMEGLPASMDAIASAADKVFSDVIGKMGEAMDKGGKDWKKFMTELGDILDML